MRPLNKEEEESDQIVQKISPNSVSILDHTFTFDSVADAGSTQVKVLIFAGVLKKMLHIPMGTALTCLFLCFLQQDIFQLVGLPLVENCLAGFNSSIFAYGQVNLHLWSKWILGF